MQRLRYDGAQVKLSILQGVQAVRRDKEKKSYCFFVLHTRAEQHYSNIL